MRRGIESLLLAVSVGLPVAAGAGNLGALAPGMSEAEVVRLMGPPDAVRLERNGVVCLTYAMQEHRMLSRLFGQRTAVVALKENRLVTCETVRSQSIRFHCSHIAGRWAPPMAAFPVCDDHCPR